MPTGWSGFKADSAIRYFTFTEQIIMRVTMFCTAEYSFQDMTQGLIICFFKFRWSPSLNFRSLRYRVWKWSAITKCCVFSIPPPPPGDATAVYFHHSESLLAKICHIEHVDTWSELDLRLENVHEVIMEWYCLTNFELNTSRMSLRPRCCILPSLCRRFDL